MHLPIKHPDTTSQRPKVKARLLLDGIPAKVYESLEEMRVRLSGLRKRGDMRSVERILYAHDDTNASGQKGHHRNNPASD